MSSQKLVNNSSATSSHSNGSSLMSYSKVFRFQQLLRATLLLMLSLFCLSGLHRLAKAATFDSAASAGWEVGTTWSPVGVPGAGDSVQLNSNTVTVSDPRSFGGGLGDDSSVAGGSGTFSITSTGTLTHVSGSTLVKNSGIDARITGSGTFFNQGTMEIETNRLLMFSGSPTLENSGLFILSESGSRLELGNSGADNPQFNNVTGGTVRVALPFSSDVARITSSNTGVNGGTYVNAGGNAIDFDQGVLVFGSGNSGSLTDASFANLFGNISADGGTTPNNPLAELRIAGGWDDITLTPSTDLSRVRLASHSGVEALYARPTGTTINVTSTGGFIMGNILSGGTPTLEVATGRTMTNAVGSLIIKESGVDGRLIGNGTFANQGTFELKNNRLLMFSGSPTLENTGLFLLSENGSQLALGNSASEAPQFINLPGGTLRVALSSTSDVARITPSNTSVVNGSYQNLGGNAIDFDQGALVFGPANSGSLTDASFANLFGNISADGGTTPNNPLAELRLAGGWDNITLTGATDLSRVRLASHTGADALVTRPGGTTINVTTPGGITIGNILSGGTPTLQIDTGRVLTNAAGSLIVKGSGVDARVIGNGTFLNQGTLELQNNRLLMFSGSPTFENEGLVLFSENGSRIQIGNSGSEAPVFNNQADAVVRVDLPTGASSALVNKSSNVSATFNNVGTLEILRGTLDIASSVTSVPQVTAGGTTLDGGTWRIIADGVGNDSTLNLAAGGTSAGSITTINADASVLLSSDNGGNATFTQLGVVQTLAGSLHAHGTQSLNVGSAMNVTGTLGGDGTFNSTGSILFNGGVLDPSALDGTAGTLTINGNLSLSNTTELTFSLGAPDIVGSGINDLIEVNGDLVLDGILDITSLGSLENGVYRLFHYTGTLTDNGLMTSNPNYIINLGTAGQVNLQIIPEPATGLLLLTGIVLFRRKRRAEVC